MTEEVWGKRRTKAEKVRDWKIYTNNTNKLTERERERERKSERAREREIKRINESESEGGE